MSERAHEHSLPAVHVLHLIELVKRWDVPQAELLSRGEIPRASLDDPTARIPIRAYTALVERARALTAEPALGILFGLQMRASAHGYLGFAAMTASTLRDALDLAVRFAPTRTSAFGLRQQIDGDLVAIVIDEHADFGAARDAMLFALLVGIWQIGNALTGRELGGEAEFAFAEPGYYARFSAVAPRVRFDRPANRLLFRASLLDLPLTMADREAQHLAREQCERALAALGVDGRIAPRVRALLGDSDKGGVRSVEAIAQALHVSPRTLKRRLAAENAAYSTLLEEHQRERALLLLRSSELSIDEVGDRLGYSDVANFTRAFRRWTGTTPSAFRRSKSP